MCLCLAAEGLYSKVHMSRRQGASTWLCLCLAIEGLYSENLVAPFRHELS